MIDMTKGFAILELLINPSSLNDINTRDNIPSRSVSQLQMDTTALVAIAAWDDSAYSIT